MSTSLLKLYYQLLPVSFKRKMPAAPRLWVLWVFSLLQTLRSRKYFASVQSYCLFVGYPRTGHTLLNAMLNAHPDVVLSNELHDLLYPRCYFGRLQLFYLIERNSRLFHLVKKSFHTGYSYHIEGAWQGRFRTIKVIGNKDAQYVSRTLMVDPGAVDRLAKLAGMPLRVFHVTRNPLDTIATMSIKSLIINPGRVVPSSNVIDEAITVYFRYAEVVQQFINNTNHPIFHLRHEDFVANPREVFRQMLCFLDLNADEAFINNACSIVFENTNKSRGKVAWTTAQVERVRQLSANYHYLRGYFEDN